MRNRSRDPARVSAGVQPALPKPLTRYTYLYAGILRYSAYEFSNSTSLRPNGFRPWLCRPLRKGSRPFYFVRIIHYYLLGLRQAICRSALGVFNLALANPHFTSDRHRGTTPASIKSQALRIFPHSLRLIGKPLS